MRPDRARPEPIWRVLRAALCVALSWGLVVSSGAWALGPFEKNHPLVQKGIDAYEAGRYEESLQAFEEAKKELPQSPALEFNRGNALYKLGRKDEAKEAYHHVTEAGKGDLRQKDFYNLGNAWAEMGNNKEAIAAYRKALTLDPKDQMARHNLEVVLRNIPPPPQSGPDGGTDGGGQDGGKPDAGRDGGSDGGRDGGSDGGRDGGSDGGQDGGNDGGQGGDGGQGDGGQGDGGSGSKGNPRGDGGQPNEQPKRERDGGLEPDAPDAGEESEAEEGLADGGVDLSKKDAERLLDSMKQTEKNLQLWRFQQKKRSRKPNEKDW